MDSGYESNTKSGIKLQLVFDYMNQIIDQLNLTEGIRSDQGYRKHLSNISSNDLLISDLGYFVPSSFKQINEIGAYFISRRYQRIWCRNKSKNGVIRMFRDF